MIYTYNKVFVFPCKHYTVFWGVPANCINAGFRFRQYRFTHWRLSILYPHSATIMIVDMNRTNDQNANLAESRYCFPGFITRI